jgi:membrane peptidoglycan carboxypeptidase
VLPDEYGYDEPGAEMPRRPSGRQTSGRQSNQYDEPTIAAPNGGRRIGPPAGRERNGGGGLLSFARAASSTMRAIITGQHRAQQPRRAAPPRMDAPLPVFASDDTDEERPQPKPYRRSRARLVIHKRWERRELHSRHMLTASITTGFMATVLLGLSIFGGGNVASFYADTSNKLSELANPNGFPQTTRFYDRNGNLLWEMLDTNNNNADYRTYVPIGLIPRNLINATVDTENKTFWTDAGIDVNSIIRAAIANGSSGGISQGGSTITQQLIKNAFFVDPKTGVADENLQRKIQEALMSYAVTQQYSKPQILEFYLNDILYGYLSRGIEAAAENYFSLMPGVDPTTHQFTMGVQHLDLAQAALLAGLPQGPSLYSPCGTDNGVQDRRAAALQRMHDVVLAGMLSVNDITQQQFNEADAEAHKPDFFQCRTEGVELAPHFVDYVRYQVLDPMLDPADPLGAGDEMLAHAGWNVYTTLDLNLEKQVEQTVKHYLFETHHECYLFDCLYGGEQPALSLPQNQGGHNINDAAAVVMDPNTGDILAMDGSGSYEKQDPNNREEGGSFNAATSEYRQVGSSFKPIVYATAFEMGWSPAIVMQNVRTCFPFVAPAQYGSPAYQACGQWYAPVNYNDSFGVRSNGEPGQQVHVRDALDNSLNIPAVQALYFAGEQNVIIQAERMGIHSKTFADSTVGPSIALGSAAISLLDMTDAYSVFANGGYHVAPRSILMITDTQGNVIPGGDFHNVTKTQVLSPQTAFLITNILADNNARVPEFGDNNALTFHNQPYVAAKTGTTDSFVDNVAMGYTPYLAVGVWAGNADNTPMSANTIGITGAAPMWHDIIQEATKYFNYPNSYWPIPAGVGVYSVNNLTGLAPYSGTSGSYSDWFNDGMLPDVS